MASVVVEGESEQVRGGFCVWSRSGVAALTRQRDSSDMKGERCRPRRSLVRAVSALGPSICSSKTTASYWQGFALRRTVDAPGGLLRSSAYFGVRLTSECGLLRSAAYFGVRLTSECGLRIRAPTHLADLAGSLAPGALAKWLLRHHGAGRENSPSLPHTPTTSSSAPTPALSSAPTSTASPARHPAATGSPSSRPGRPDYSGPRARARRLRRGFDRGAS
jgi:hypothetical protein